MNDREFSSPPWPAAPADQWPAEFWLRVARCPGMDATAAWRLQEVLGDHAAFLAASRSRLQAAGLNEAAADRLSGIGAADIGPDLEWLAAPGHHLVTPDQDSYPVLLRHIPQAPLCLYVDGDPGVLGLPQIAMVGSRNPTSGGLDNAREFARHLGQCGFVITSGLASGIDTASHEGALEAGSTTVAVAGTGPDLVYPRQNRDLAARIAATGAVVTEHPVGSPPRREHFPSRNRILSGLAVGTLVVEAARRSGSLITARLAMEQGREVFAIPGSIHNPLAKGCHRLIRDGAKLVESARDIFEELRPLVGAMAESEAPVGAQAGVTPDLDPDYRHLLEALGFEPRGIDSLAEKSGLTAEVVSSMLLILELNGLVEAMPGGMFARVR